MAQRSNATLADIGEFGLIDRITQLIERANSRVDRRANGASPRGTSLTRVVLGPGDDAAVVRPPPGRDLVVTTDSLVEDVHFRWRTQTPRTVGRRSLVANLSDLAAMGAEPLAFVVAFCAPETLAVRAALGVVRGMLDEAAKYGCPLIGGNVSSARETSIGITAFGSVKRGKALQRGSARARDRIFVTGSLGGAALAVARSENAGIANRRLSVPRLHAGAALCRMKGVGGCIDVSDGLLADLGHLLAPRKLGADLVAAAVPRPRGFRAACDALGVDPNSLLFAGGEDYELLFTLHTANEATPAVLSAKLGVPVSEIGRISAARGVRGAPLGLGWRHF